MGDSDRAEGTLKELSGRNDIIKIMHRALANPRPGRRARDRAIRPPRARPDEKIAGRVWARGLAGDEMDERLYLVIDGVDGRVHHVEFPDGSHLKDIGRDITLRWVQPPPDREPPIETSRSTRARMMEFYRPSRSGTWNASASSSEREPSRSLSRLSARMSAGWRPCVARDTSNGSTTTNGKIPADIAPSVVRPTIAREAVDGPRIKILSSEKLEQQIGTRPPPGSIVNWTAQRGL